MIRIEVCTGSIEDSLTACNAGASRIELNCSLETGGLSPSPGVLSEVLSAVSVPVVVMVRPRSGDFTYSPPEKRAMLADMELFFKAGAAGIVFGSLTGGSSVDADFVSKVRKVADDGDIVFHRAFDLTADPAGSAMLLADLGVDRILTSGAQPTAFQGRELLKDLVSLAAGSIEILPGSGINSGNASELVRYTGCKWVHGSFSVPVDSMEGAGIFIRSAKTSREEIEMVRRALSTD